jgi:hypothetical protein
MSAVLIIKPTEPIPGHLHREGVVVTPWEAVAYDELKEAAGKGAVCPLNLDLEMMFGCNSGSVASTVVSRLERKGLIIVRRFQKFREVQIVATGDWTKRSPAMHVERPHVPRGAGSRSPVPTERKGYRKGRL